MSDFKLYTLDGKVEEIIPSTVILEKQLQTLIERNMETMFGVKFLKSEYIISDGRMDSIGIDENNCPVIFEYKKSSNANVINQGLFYLDWLLDHKADFKLLVMEQFGTDLADKIDWSYPCVICIANDFTKYDLHAINQMQKNIKLVKYRKYEQNLIGFEFLNSPKTKAIIPNDDEMKKDGNSSTHIAKLKNVPKSIKDLYEQVCEFIEEFDDEIISNQLKYYIAYKKIQNVACIEINKKFVIINLKLDPNTVAFEEGFSRDMRNIGHYGTGDVQLNIRNEQDLEKAKPLIERACREA